LECKKREKKKKSHSPFFFLAFWFPLARTRGEKKKGKKKGTQEKTTPPADHSGENKLIAFTRIKKTTPFESKKKRKKRDSSTNRGREICKARDREKGKKKLRWSEEAFPR
jgi:hypothetical protein